MDYLKKAHTETDIILEKIEKRLERDYNDANKQINKLFSVLFKRFEKVFEQKIGELNSGLITKKEYTEFMVQYVLLSKEWKRIVKELANFYVGINNTELNLINNKLSEIYALNYNAIKRSVKKEVTKD